MCAVSKHKQTGKIAMATRSLVPFFQSIWVSYSKLTASPGVLIKAVGTGVNKAMQVLWGHFSARREGCGLKMGWVIPLHR